MVHSPTHQLGKYMQHEFICFQLIALSFPPPIFARLCRLGFEQCFPGCAARAIPCTQTPSQWYLAQLGGAAASFVCDILLGKKYLGPTGLERVGTGNRSSYVLFLASVIGVLHSCSQTNELLYILVTLSVK